MNTTLRSALNEVAAIPGVRAALLAIEVDGLAVDSVASCEIDTDALSAFATALFRRTRQANAAAGLGDTHRLSLDATNGRMFVVACGELSLVVLAESDASVGVIRLAMQRAAREVS